MRGSCGDEKARRPSTPPAEDPLLSQAHGGPLPPRVAVLPCFVEEPDAFTDVCWGGSNTRVMVPESEIF